MKKRMLGKSGIEATVVAMGTWVTGGWMWGSSDRKESIRAIQASLDAGVNFIDTAPIYGFGLSEEIVGEAIAGRRDGVVLATKCGNIWDEARGDFFFKSDENGHNPNGKIHIYRCLAPDVIRKELERSLKRLKTDVIDLYQTHWQDSTTPIEDSMAELMKLKQEGKIRAIGCSNATCQQMDAYRAAGQLDTDQEHYSMVNLKPEGSSLPYCAQHDMAFLAYSPLGRGLLTGKIGPDWEFKDGDVRKGNPKFSKENLEKIQRLLNVVRGVADGHGAKVSHVVLAWTLAQQGCTHVLTGARNVEQAQDNAAGGRITLSQGEIDSIRAAVKAYTAEGGA
jgi:methylglyoxal reductase